MYLQFGRANASSNSSTVDCHIWSETNGKPGTILHTETLNIADIIALAGNVTVMFASPVSVSGAFYIGCDIDYTTPGDTVALVSNSDGDQNGATAWEQWGDGNWYPFDDQSSWGLEIGLAAHPIIDEMEASVSPSAPSIASGGSVQITATASVPTATFNWSPTTGLSCSNCANPIASPGTTTEYTLTVTDPSVDCTLDLPVTVDVVPVGLVDNLLGHEVKVYPNPNTGTFNLEFSLDRKSDLDIAVYNNTGQKIYHEALDRFTGDYRKGINLEFVPAGIYHLRITEGNQSYDRKLIFQ